MPLGYPRHVVTRVHATSASSKVVGWTFSGALDVRRRPRGLKVATDAGALRIGVLRRQGGTVRSGRTTVVAIVAAAQNGTSACSRCFKPLPCDWALKPGRYDTMSKNSAARLPQLEIGGGR